MNIIVARVYKVSCQLFLSIICYGDYERTANVPKYSFDWLLCFLFNDSGFQHNTNIVFFNSSFPFFLLLISSENKMHKRTLFLPFKYLKIPLQLWFWQNNDNNNNNWTYSYLSLPGTANIPKLKRRVPKKKSLKVHGW